ncbi:hypothetical protein BD289DRAFT_206922 [Coniella lustricola]|uniref:Uncharacterized protein n=1 Tax=Coniella lustricola TaxID=2025994 RepID=A0A2T3AC59_9PEZI|nr:hypothetical protein BD289DRAFT_206922 [Coniella lustricola]
MTLHIIQCIHGLGLSDPSMPTIVILWTRIQVLHSTETRAPAVVLFFFGSSPSHQCCPHHKKQRKKGRDIRRIHCNCNLESCVICLTINYE